MNMISTGAFLTEMDASEKHKNSLVNKLVSAWEQKNSKTARAGGVSLMALSLAACGSSEDEDAVSYTQTQLDAAKVAAGAAATATAEAAAAIAQTAAVSAALKHTDGTTYASVDAAKTAGINTSSADAIAGALKGSDGTQHATVDAAVTSNDTTVTSAALKDAGGTQHATVDAAVTSNDAAVTTTAQTALETSLLTAASSSFATVSALQTAYNAAVAPVAGLNSVLTTAGDVVNGTTSNDAIAGTNLTYTATDVIVGGGGTDTLTIDSTAANVSAAATVVGIENIVFNITSSDLAEAAATLTNVKTGSVTINQLQNGAAATSAITDAGSISLTFGGKVTGAATIGQIAATDLVVAAGTAGTVNITGGTTGTATVTGGATLVDADVAVSTGTASVTGTTGLAQIDVDGKTMVATTTNLSSDITLTGVGVADTATVSIGAAAAITAANAVETVNISTGTVIGDQTQTAISVATFDTNAATTYNLTGANNIVLAGDEAMFDGKTVTNSGASGTTELKLTTVATSDLDAVSNGTTINANQTDAVGAADATLTVKNNASVLISADLDDIADGTESALTIDSTELTSGNETLNLTITASTTDKDSDVIVSDFETVNLSTTGATAAVSTAKITAGASSAITLATGSKALTLGVVTGKTFDATGYTGAITMTPTTALSTSATFGSGNDSVNMTTGDTITLDGGAGVDTLDNSAGNFTTGTFSNFEIVQIANGDSQFKASQLDGQSYSIKGNDGTGDDINIDNGVALSYDSQTLDLSKLSFDTNVTDFDIVIAAGSISASLALGGTFSITGSGQIENLTATTVSGAMTVHGNGGADVLVTGSGADTISGGEGIDTITSNGGIDSIDLAETTAAADIIIMKHEGATNVDTVTGFTGVAADDVIHIDMSEMNGTNLMDSAGTKHTATTAHTMGTYTVGTAGAFNTAGEAIIKVTNTTGINAFTDLNTAIDANNITMDAGGSGFAIGEGMLTVYYDADDGQAIVGYLESDVIDVFDDGNTFVEIVKMTMSTAEYDSLVAANFDMV
jgi:hypothetical protein